MSGSGCTGKKQVLMKGAEVEYFWGWRGWCVCRPRPVQENKHVIFTGNGYSAEWPVEATKRGLPNLNTTPKALAAWNSDKNKKPLARTKRQTSLVGDMNLGLHFYLFFYGREFRSTEKHCKQEECSFPLSQIMYAFGLHFKFNPFNL